MPLRLEARHKRQPFRVIPKNGKELYC